MDGQKDGREREGGRERKKEKNGGREGGRRKRRKEGNRSFISRLARKDRKQANTAAVSIYFAKMPTQISLACVLGSVEAAILPPGLRHAGWKMNHPRFEHG